MMRKSTNVGELKWTNQNLTDYRLHQWIWEHQNAVYQSLQNPTFESISKVVSTAFIIYTYYFRLLIKDENTMREYDNQFRILLEEIQNAKKEKSMVRFNSNVLGKAIQIVADLSRTVQEGNYFFNLHIDAKKFSDALEHIKELPGGKK